MAAPLVSVVVPTYNQPALLEETLHAVFAQSFDDFEVVVVDDGSTDDTPARLAELVARHRQRLRVVRQENAGVGPARNRGLDEARGKFVALLDHDDLWLPGKLATQVLFMQRRPDCIACVVPYSYSTEPHLPVYDVDVLLEGSTDGETIARPWRASCRMPPPIMSSVLVIDRERAAGLRYGTRRRCTEDVSFQFQLSGRGPIGLASRQVLAIYRLHVANASGEAAYYHNGIRFLRELDRNGAFADLAGVQRRDLLDYIASIGRSAAVRDVLAGRRLAGLTTFLREAGHQVRAGRWKFVATFPAIMFMPERVLRRRWQDPR